MYRPTIDGATGTAGADQATSCKLCQPHRPQPPHALRRPLALAMLAAGLSMHAGLSAAAALGDLAELSLEELANVRVTSVSKRPERLSDAPASIYVIGAEEIRRSGATTLPEVLRLAPNLQVARIDARNYGISSRGFNNTLENKLLVLIDGRTVYSPLFSGVYWDAQDVVLEDVERIEVISGPGGTLWGANAVNGVINITTKPASATQGTLVAAGASKDEREGTVRYGGMLGNGSAYRVYGKYAQNDDTHSGRGRVLETGWQRRQTGFRLDSGDSEQGTTLQGDAYDGALHQAGTADIGIRGANLVGRINRQLAPGSNLSFQSYLDYTERNQPGAFVEHLYTLDLQLQHALHVGTVHDMVWGAGYRVAFDRVRNDVAFAFLPGDQNLQWGNIFLQDEITLADTLRLTGGIKLERNHYTGLEWLPTVRLSWKPHADQLLWSAVSRAVRTPSRIDRDFFAPTTPRVVNGVAQYSFDGGPNFVSEVVNTIELGYRAQPLPNVSYSATVFTSSYDRLRTLEINPAGPGSVFANGAEGRVTGLETWGTWQARQDLRLSAGLVTQRVRTASKPGVVDLLGGTALASVDPSHYWNLRASYDIGPRQELDLLLRGSSPLGNPAVPAYTALNIRYGWKVRPDLELSIVGQNLLDKSHREYGSSVGGSEFDRAAYVKLAWQR